ncbi:MAG: formylmethanofuran--tetrahydromethanopterin N-formyltransferase [Promethearchaeota archaeon]
MQLENVEIEDTFAEGFKIWISRVLITAATQEWALTAARVATGFGTSIIMSPAEAAVEKVVSPNETIDGRPGVIVQICHTKKKLLAKQLLERLGQCVLTCPTTACFCAMDEYDEFFKTGANLRYFGDGFEEKVNMYGRELWKIPVMEGEFLIDSEFGAKKGVAGGNLLLIGDDPEKTLRATEAAVKAIEAVDYTVTPFPGGICRSGSKVGSLKYSKFLIASTNHRFCPTLIGKIDDSKLPANAKSVLEIVINGLTIDTVSKAMSEAIKAAVKVPGLIKITAANYGGELGQFQIYLKDLI